MYWCKSWLSSAQLWICTLCPPRPGRGRLSTLVGVSRKRAAAMRETPTGCRQPGNPASSPLLLLWTLQSPCRYLSLVYHQGTLVAKAFSFFPGACIWNGLGIETYGLGPLTNAPNYAPSSEFFFQKTSDRSHLMNS